MDTSVHFPVTDSVKMTEPVAKTNVLLSTQSLRVHGAPKRTGGGAGGRARRKHGSIRAQLQVAASGRPGQLRATEGLHCLDDDSFFNTGNGKPCSGKETTTEWLQDQGPGAVLWPLTHEAPGSRH